MAKKGKKYTNSSEMRDSEKAYSLDEGVELALKNKYAKFDESVDLAIRLGVDPRHADQMVRSSLVLPNGTGKTIIALCSLLPLAFEKNLKIIYMCRTHSQNRRIIKELTKI